MNAAHESHAGDTGGKSLVKVTPAPPALHASWQGWLALVIAIAALILVVIGWVNFSKVQTAQTAELHAGLQAMNQRLAALTRSVASRSELNADVSTTRQTLKSFSERLDGMDAALTDLRRRSEEGRDAWIKAEAASLLMAANEQVQLYANPGMALKALENADARLRLLSDPRLIPVRQEIAREETALHAVPQVDVQGMALTLASLSESVDTLPLKRVAPDRYLPGQPAAIASREPPTLWGRFKAGVERLVKDIFTVHHLKAPIEPLLSPRQEYFLRQNLQLRLDAARAALLERDGAGFQDSVRMVREWLQRYFNAQNGGVQAAVTELAQMQQQQINPPLPDISASLTLLRRLESARNKAP